MFQKYATAIKIDNFNSILDNKIQEINQIKYKMEKGIRSLAEVPQLKNKINQFYKIIVHLIRELKQNYSVYSQFPKALNYSYELSANTIAKIIHSYQQQIIQIKNNYNFQIRQLSLELQKQYRITKLMSQQVDELKNSLNKIKKQQRDKQQIQQQKILRNKQIFQQGLNDKLELETIVQQDENMTTRRENKELNPLKLCLIDKIIGLTQQNIKKSPQTKIIQVFTRQLSNIKTNSLKKREELKKSTINFQHSFLSEKKQLDYASCKQNRSETSFQQDNKLIKMNQSMISQYSSSFSKQKLQKQKPYRTSNPLKQLNMQVNVSPNAIKLQMKNHKLLNLNVMTQQQKQVKVNEQNMKKSVKQSQKQLKYKNLIKNIINLREKQNLCKKQELYLNVGERKLEIRYEGNKKNNKKHGRGINYYSNGLTYQGDFKQNMRCGYGILKFNNNEIYKGDWQNDMLNGQGRIKNCQIISKKKKQTIGLNNWIEYIGEFKNNKFQGMGTLILENGEKFLGKFKNGLADGQGTYYKSNNQVEFGIWKNNVLQWKI